MNRKKLSYLKAKLQEELRTIKHRDNKSGETVSSNRPKKKLSAEKEKEIRNKLELKDDGIRLLRDVRRIFQSWDSPEITSNELIRELSAKRDNWANYNPKGGEITCRQLSLLFNQYDIKSCNLKNPRNLKGYKEKDIKKACTKYLSE